MGIIRLLSKRVALAEAAISACFLVVGCSASEQSPPPPAGSGGSSSANGGTGIGGARTGGATSGGAHTGGAFTGGVAGTGARSSCVPYHYSGSPCSSCHGSACTCETQYSSCYMAVCASPGTPIATPDGSRPIASLSVGDLVYSVHQGQVVAVPVERLRRVAAGSQHRVMRVELETGSVIDISSPHPTADGRRFGDLRRGDQLGGVRIVKVDSIPYHHDFTHDILPASDSGTYFAGGVMIGSTLASEWNVPMCLSTSPRVPEALQDNASLVDRDDWWR